MKKKLIIWFCRRFYKPKCRHTRFWKMHVIQSMYPRSSFNDVSQHIYNNLNQLK